MALSSPRVAATSRMRGAGIDAYGGQVRLLDLAPPAPDEVVIVVHAAGVGNWDEFVRLGDWDVGRPPPLALGVEAAGVVAAVGDDVTSLQPGEQVLTHPLPLRHQGAWAPWLLAPAALVARKPAAVAWAQAGAFPSPRSPRTRRFKRPPRSRPASGCWCTARRGHRRAGGAAGGRARRQRGGDGGPVECGAGPRLRRPGRG
jgi:Alcohol dehydrogenase GroES-like domain